MKLASERMRQALPIRAPARRVLPGRPWVINPVLTFEAMDSRAEIREFLVSRRAKITPTAGRIARFRPQSACVRAAPGRGRLARRRQQRVYARLERGNLAGVSDTVLETVATALQLDEAEREHLFALAQAARKTRTARPRRSRAQPQIRPSVQRILDALTGAPAYVGNGRLDVLAANSLCLALFSPMFANPARPANFETFLLPRPCGKTALHRLGRCRALHRLDVAQRGRPRPA